MFCTNVIKAVYIELTINLFIGAFLNCLKRFIAHRGLCHDIYSDNGTNFIKARNLIEFKKFTLA